MSRYSRWGFFKNKHNAGTAEITPAATYSISESSNTTATVFTISTNITSEPTLPYTITGTNLLSSDFDDNSLSGNITLDSNGNATITKTITNTNLNSDFTKTFQLFLQRSATSSGNVANSNVITVETFEPIQYSTSGGDSPYIANLSGQQYTFTRFQTGYGPTDFQFTRRGSNTNSIVEFVAIGGGGQGGQAYRLWRGGAEEYRTNGAGGSGGEVAFSNVAIANIDLNVTMNVTIGTGAPQPSSYVGNGNAANLESTVNGNATSFYITGISNVNLTASGGNGAGNIGTQTVPAFLQPWPDANLVYNLAADGGDSPSTSSGGGDQGTSINRFDYLVTHVPASNGSIGNGINYPSLNGANIAMAMNATPTANEITVAGGGDSGSQPGLGEIGRGGNGQFITSNQFQNPPSVYPGAAAEDGAVFVKFPYFDSYNEIV